MLNCYTGFTGCCVWTTYHHTAHLRDTVDSRIKYNKQFISFTTLFYSLTDNYILNIMLRSFMERVSLIYTSYKGFF